MFRIIYKSVNAGGQGVCGQTSTGEALGFSTVQEALDEALKRSGNQTKSIFTVVEELVSVASKPTTPPVETKITPIKEGFQVL